MILNGHELTASQTETLYFALLVAGKTVISTASTDSKLAMEQFENLAELTDMLDNPAV